MSKQKIIIKQEAAKVKKKRIEVLQGGNINGSSVTGVRQSVGGATTGHEEEQNEFVSSRAGDKENNKPYNMQISSNVEQSDGIRKEIPQIMENGN